MPVALASTVVGRGRPALVLHGLFGSGTNWRTIARRLGARLECHLLIGCTPSSRTLSRRISRHFSTTSTSE